MCGRYVILADEDEREIVDILEKINEKFGEESVKTGEIFPTDKAPVLLADDKTIVPFPVKWGFPIKWGFSNWNGKGSIINARAETVFEKRMFSKPLQNRRCVIPSSGFYEWSHEEGKTKDKFLIRSPDSKTLYMAGITDTFVDNGGSRFDAFAILTTSANASVSPIHNRMPVILTQNEIERWIFDYKFAFGVLSRAGKSLEVKRIVNKKITF